MLSKLKLKLDLNSAMIKQIAYLFCIALLYAILGMINFANLEFEPERAMDKTFWINYILVIGFALVIMFLSILMKKDKNKTLPKITDEVEVLRALKSTLIEKGLYDEFKDYLKELNKDRRLTRYRSLLIKKRDKVKKQKDIDKYDTLIKDTYAKDFDINKFNVKIKLITVNTIFSGFSDKTEEGTVFYQGNEGLALWVLPTLISGMFFSLIMLSVLFNFKDTSAEQWKNLITTLWISLSYLMRGISYGDHSINVVYFGALENRIGKVRSFFKKKNIVADVFENPNYKYKVEIKEEAENG